jgi:hypothetical protein
MFFLKASRARDAREPNQSCQDLAASLLSDWVEPDGRANPFRLLKRTLIDAQAFQAS